MGCDIHCHIEVKIGSRWEHYSAPHVPRSYALFGRLAGVRRDDVDPLVAPRGIPPDLSLITEIAWTCWGADAHTPSWLHGWELDLIVREIELGAHGMQAQIITPFGYLFESGFAVSQDKPRKDVITDCRIVFWFDN